MQELEEMKKVVSRFNNRIRNRDRTNLRSRFIVKESKDPTEIQGPKINVKTIKWYGVPNQVKVRFEGDNESETIRRDKLIDEFNQQADSKVSYNQQIPKYEQGELFLAKLKRSGQLRKFIQFANYPVINGKQGITVNHETNMFFEQADDSRWKRNYRLSSSMYNEKIGEDLSEDEFINRFYDGSEEIDTKPDTKSEYEKGMADALNIVKRTKGGKIDKRNALSTAIDQTGPGWARKEGMLLVNTKLKDLDASYSRDIYKDVRASVDEAVGGDHKDASEFVVQR